MGTFNTEWIVWPKSKWFEVWETSKASSKLVFLKSLECFLSFKKLSLNLQKSLFTLNIDDFWPRAIPNDFLTAHRSCTTKFIWKKFLQKIFTLLLAHFASQSVNYSRHSESLKNVGKWANSCFRRKISSISNSSESLTVPHIIDQFGRKRCQKERKDVSYQFLFDFFRISNYLNVLFLVLD